VIESIKLGAKDFVVKPFQPERLLEAVGKAMA
jgi:two-component system chemotaxis response regulator CheY